MRNKSASWVFLPILALSLIFQTAAFADTDVRFEQKLGARLSDQTPVLDEHGETHPVSEYFRDKPTLLSFVYFGCPNLCTLVLNGLAEGLKESGIIAGQEVNILSISIDPKEKPALALAKKRSYLARLGLTGDENPAWHFLTASQPSIQHLADEAGFHFAYDPATGEFNHPSGLVVLTPDGQVSRYLFGIRFSAQDLTNAVHEAALGKSHRSLTEIILNCFHYRPENGRYGHFVILFLQIVSSLMILCLGILFYGLAKKRVLYE